MVFDVAGKSGTKKVVTTILSCLLIHRDEKAPQPKPSEAFAHKSDEGPEGSSFFYERVVSSMKVKLPIIFIWSMLFITKLGFIESPAHRWQQILRLRLGFFRFY